MSVLPCWRGIRRSSRNRPALTAIIGFSALLKTADVITNATFAPFTVYGVVALIYFAPRFPPTRGAGWLERRLRVG